jgi:hypothetical protein
MSTGTKIVQNALKQLGVYSPVKPTNSESLEDVKDLLNSLRSRWEDDGIKTGAVPLNAIGDEFSEPQGLTNTFVFNLAIEAQPLFPNSNISPELRLNANKTFKDMLHKYQSIDIPTPKARSTLPKGMGNKRYFYDTETFFDAGEEIA